MRDLSMIVGWMTLGLIIAAFVVGVLIGMAL